MTMMKKIFLFMIAFLAASPVAFAQDEFDEEETSTTFKAPKRTQVVDKNPTINVHGVVVDAVSKKPLAGVRLKTLNDNRYAAMTDADGKFTIKVPTFATALYVQSPQYMSQQVYTPYRKGRKLSDIRR